LYFVQVFIAAIDRKLSVSLCVFVRRFSWVDAVMMYAHSYCRCFFAKFAGVPRDAMASANCCAGQRILTLPLPCFVVAFVLFQGRGAVLAVQPQRPTRSGPHDVVAYEILLSTLLGTPSCHLLLTSTTTRRPVGWLVAGNIP
jgi:hypothetical protein